jgi:hypothetical protein
MTRLCLYMSVSKSFDGICVSCYSDDKADPNFIRVQDALSVIKACDPLRYAQLKRDLERIWVLVIAGGAARFDPTIWTCILDPRSVANKTTEEVAACIVHEATHARLWRMGFRYQEEIRARIEAVCFRRELAFAQKIPDGETVRQNALYKLGLCAGGTYYTNQAALSRAENKTMEAFQYLGMGWMARIWRLTVRWRRKTDPIAAVGTVPDKRAEVARVSRP